MKRLGVFFIPVLCLLILAQCGSESGKSFSVSGDLEYPADFSIKLIYLGIEKAQTIDSTIMKSTRDFNLEGNLKHPGLFLLRIGSVDDIYLVIQPGDKIILDINNSEDGVSYTVEGSVDSRLVNEIMIQNKRVRASITKVSMEYEQSKNNPETFLKEKIRLDSTYDGLIKKHKQQTIDFIKQNSQSLATIFAVYQNFGQRNSQPLFDKYDDLEIYDFVDSCLTPLYPSTDAVIALNRDVTLMKEQIKQKEYSEKVIAPGKHFPDFSLKDISGKTVKLSDYSGEPVIFVFFAVWNEQSVDMVKGLNNMVNQKPYKDQKIVAISFDKSKEKLNDFVKSNQIKFPVICDYNYWDSPLTKQFGVREIPDLLLINKDHITYQRNLLLEELKQTLTEWK